MYATFAQSSYECYANLAARQVRLLAFTDASKCTRSSLNSLKNPLVRIVRALSLVWLFKLCSIVMEMCTLSNHDFDTDFAPLWASKVCHITRTQTHTRVEWRRKLRSGLTWTSAVRRRAIIHWCYSRHVWSWSDVACISISLECKLSDVSFVWTLLKLYNGIYIVWSMWNAFVS